MSVLAELAASPAGWLLLFSITFGLVMWIGLRRVFREHDREMAKIEREIEDMRERRRSRTSEWVKLGME